MGTANSIGEASIALIMGFLVIKLRHKALYLSGVFLVIASAIGNFFAPSLFWMQIFYFLEGTGSIMISIIAYTFVGKLLPFEQKGKAVSYIIASVFLVSFAFPPLINFLADTQGWRYNFLLFVLPAALVGLLISWFGIPSKIQEKTSMEKSIVASFKSVLSNRSAVSCFLSQFFFIGTSISLYTLPFFRNQFSLPRSSTVFILMAASGIYMISTLVTGRLVNKLTAKKLVVIGTLIDGIFIAGIFSSPTLWLSLTFNFIHVWFAGMAISSFSCLILDQVPKSRGTMISVSRVFGKAGDSLTPLIGGLVLLILASYSILGFVLGIMSIIGSIIVLAFAKNPNKTE